MKKEIIILTLLLILIVPTIVAENSSTTPTFLDDTWDINKISLITGTSEDMTYKELLIFVCIFIVILSILYDLLKTINFFDYKIINFGIALIFTLIGSYAGAIYSSIKILLNISSTITFFTEIGAIKIAVAIVLIFVVLFIMKSAFRALKQSRDKDNLEDFANKTSLMAKILRIKQKALGIK